MNVLKNLKNNLITKHRYFTTFAFVAGAISDITQPIAPFSLYFLYFFIVACLFLFFLRKKNIFLNDYFNYSLIGLLVSFSIFSFQKISNAEEKGLLASNFNFAKKFQTDLGIISEDLKLIKKEIVDLNESNKNIEMNTEKIAQGVDEINTNLKQLQSGTSSGIIKEPKTAMDFYSNAKFYELKGDYQKARQSYNKYFSFQLNYVDPHYSYQSFLKIQEGFSGAREIYNLLYQNDKRPIIEFVSILLNSSVDKIELLKDFVKRNNTFAPAYIELAKEFSSEKKGSQSLADKKIELEMLTEFKKLDEKGHFVKYFIDQKEAAKLLEYADNKLQLLKNVSEQKNTIPVTLVSMHHNAGWSIQIEISEPFREIFYRTSNLDKFKSLGFSRFVDQTTGLKMPNNSFEASCPAGDYGDYSLACDKVNMKIEVKYLDINKKEQGPFDLIFNGNFELKKSCDEWKQQTSNSDYTNMPGCEKFSLDSEKKFPKAFVLFPPSQQGSAVPDMKDIYLNPENCFKINKFAELKWPKNEEWVIKYCKNN